MENGEVCYGLELECAVPREFVKGKKGGHCSGKKFGAGEWTAEDDGSLDTDEDDYSTVEFCSPVFTLKTWDKTFDVLREYMHAKEDSLDNIEINSSCGSHIHFSWKPDDCNFYNRLMYQFGLKEMHLARNLIFLRVKEELPQMYDQFRGHYFRDYAQKVDNISDANDKYHEFHYTTVQGMEWRSVNMLGVTSWKDMRKLVRIASEVIDNVIKEGMVVGEVEFEPKPSPELRKKWKSDMYLQTFLGKDKEYMEISE